MTISPYFHNRSDAGRELAKALSSYRSEKALLILALPRGGVPVASEIAKALHAPLDLMLVRKLGVPGQEELAMGALAMGDIQVLNKDVVEMLDIPPYVIAETAEKERKELLRRNDLYRQGREMPDMGGRTVILVDDGMATGADMRAAVQAVRSQNPAHIAVAVPIASDTAISLISRIADEVLCLHMPELFYGVGQAYEDFTQTTDEEVKQGLKSVGNL